MKLILFSFTLLSVSTAFARADVSLRNGNFYGTFHDLVMPGGLELKIERVYNSKSDYIGIFGFGWGSEYETQLKSDPDGSLIVSAFGGGADNRFVPKNYKVADLEKSANEMVAAAKKAGILNKPQQVVEYRKKIINDFDFRSKQYGVFVEKGWMPRKSVAEGAQFTSTHYLYQYITKVKGGYILVFEGGNIQKFNETGKLVQIADRNKNFINFSYDKNNHLALAEDNQSRKIKFVFNGQNRLEKVMGENNKTAAFKYNGDGNLIYSKDDHGVENSYLYSSDRYRNLIEIGYLNDKLPSGKTKKMAIQYYGSDKNINVKSVINPDGSVNEYDYIRDPKKPNYFGVHVSVKDADGARVSDAKYEYFSKIKEGGENLTTKMIALVDGNKTETLYDEKLGFPVKVTNNNRVTTMQYDVKGRLIKKTTPHETTELSYEPKVGKINKVIRRLKGGTVLWSQFEYDLNTGNLIYAKNSEKKSVKILYDVRGKIQALVDQAKHQLTFKYNEHSRPIEITDAKLGTLKFSYKNSGEVDKIENNGGDAVRQQVMAGLQSLIDITSPSGASVGF